MHRDGVEGCEEISMPSLGAYGRRIPVEVRQSDKLLEYASVPGPTDFVMVKVPEEPA